MSDGKPHKPMQIHATGVAINTKGVALIGKSGSGKSDLALRLIDRGAMLVCDDRLEIFEREGSPWIGACPNIGGQIEVRGVGIVPTPNVDAVALHLIVDLDKAPDRLPDPWPRRRLAGFAVPELHLNALEPSAAIKIEIALRCLLDQEMLPVRQEAGAA